MPGSVRLLSLEGKAGEIEIAAGEDNADFFTGGADFIGNSGSGGDGGGRLDDDFHAFPDGFHGLDDFGFGDGDNVVNVFFEDGEGERGEGGAETVGDGVAGAGGRDGTGTKRAISIVGVGGLAADDFDLRALKFGGERDAAEKTSATDGSEDVIEVGDFFEKFEGDGALAGDDLHVVVGMNHVGVSLVGDFAGGGFAGFESGLANGDLAAVGANGGMFGSGRVGRHNDPGGNAAKLSGAGECGAVIAGGVGHHAVAGLVVGEGEDCVGGAANFEGAGFLEIFTFEEELGAGGFVEVLGGEDGRAVNLMGDAF